MKGSDVITQLIKELPSYTDAFSSNLSITSLTRIGTTVTAVTSTPHGLADNNVIVIAGAKTPLTISNLVQVDGVATADTATKHDLTVGFQGQDASDSPNIEISGADQTEYNGLHSLLSVANRKTFTFAVDDAAVSPATGAITLLQDFPSGYNGVQVVAVVDTTTFTYEIETTPESPAQGTIVAASGFRVSGAVDLTTAKSAYTPQADGDLWAFVVLEDTTANKDRNIDSDATYQQASGTEFRQTIITPFSVFVFAPTSAEISAREARDDMSDVRIALFKSLLRHPFTDGFTAEQVFNTVFNSDGFAEYTSAYYVHRFVFEVVSDITQDDTVRPSESVAFRDVTLNFNDELGTTELSVTADLDEVQLLVESNLITSDGFNIVTSNDEQIIVLSNATA